jgi:hypothetical protein
MKVIIDRQKLHYTVTKPSITGQKLFRRGFRSESQSNKIWVLGIPTHDLHKAGISNFYF